MLFSKFKGYVKEGQVSENDLPRMLRFVMASELDAVNEYERLAQQIEEYKNNPKVKKVFDVLMHVAYEERVHVAEFMKVLKEICPSDEKAFLEGMKEHEDHDKEHEQK